MRLEFRSLPFALKASAEPGMFTGRASVYGVVDSYGDVVMPGAFAKSLQKNGNTIKVLAQHNPDEVIGIATLTDSPDALLADGKLVLELQAAKDMYTRISAGLIDGISIGYVTQNATYDKNGLRQLNEVDLWEISLVTFPANDFARVTGVKGRRRRKATAVDQSVADSLSAIDAQIDDLDTAFDDLLAQLGIADPDEDSGKMIARLTAEIKAGAKFSKENAAKIKAIHESVATAHESLKALVEMIEGDDDDKAAKLKNEQAESLVLSVTEALGSLCK